MRRKRRGKGLVQKQEREDKAKEVAREMAKPFARYRDDADLDRMLRERELSDDPMLAYVREQRRKVLVWRPLRRRRSTDRTDCAARAEDGQRRRGRWHGAAASVQGAAAAAEPLRHPAGLPMGRRGPV